MTSTPVVASDVPAPDPRATSISVTTLLGQAMVVVAVAIGFLVLGSVAGATSPVAPRSSSRSAASPC